MTTAIADKSVGEVLTELLKEADGVIQVIDPSPRTIDEFIQVAIGMNDPPQIQLLSEEQQLKELMEDFLIAGKAADLVEQDVLAMRTMDARAGNELVITDEQVIAIISAGTAVAALATEEGGFVDSASDYYQDMWADAEEFTLRTPPLSRVKATLSEEIGADVEADFSAVLDSLETARGSDNGLDEVMISLLVAAKNEVLLYDISKWGEDVGIASKATFSRTKTMLEDMGLIDTEKVPIDVGRPRLRLKFAREELSGADPDELASVAQSLLS